MPALTGVGRKLADLAAKIRARNAGPYDSPNGGSAAVEEPPFQEHSSENPPLNSVPKASLLEYVSGRWLDADSIADTNSTITRAQIEATAPREFSSIHAIGDPSYRARPDINDAVQRIYSLPDSRSGSSLYYLEGGRPTSPKKRKLLHDHGHRYCCGNPLAEPVPGNLFPVTETVHPDWRVHALGRDRAGYWSLQDLSEQHLTDRLFYNAKIRTPSEHLHGSQKAAAQDLESLRLENLALEISSAEAEDHATHLQEYVGTLRKSIAHVEEEIDMLRLELDTNR